MLRLLAFLIFAKFTLIAPGALAAPLAADEERRELNGAEVSFLRDPDGRYDLAEISASAMSEKFQVLARGLSFGYTTDVIWLRIALQRIPAAPSAWQLEVTNSYINDVRFYAPTQDGFTVAQAGDRFPYAERPFSFYNPIFTVDLPDSAQHHFYLRVQSDSSTSAGLLLWQPTALRAERELSLLLLGGVMGMMAMSLIFSLLNVALTHNRRLLSFAAMTATLILMVPAQLGLLAPFLLPHSPLLADLLVPWSLGIVIASMLLTFRQPLEIPQHYPRLDRLLQAMVLIGLLAPLTREFDLYAQIGGPLLQFLFMTALLMNSAVAWQRWRMKMDGAVYFLMAHVVFLLSLPIGRLAVTGFLPAAPWMFSSWIPGLLTFLVLTQIGLVVELRTSNRTRRTAQTAAQLAMQQAHQEKQLREEQTVFFSFVAHELRSPLGVIVAGLKNLRRELMHPSAAMHARLERIERATQRMATMIDRHLQLQRLANADFQVRWTPLPPRDAANEALRQVRETYAQRRFVLSIASNLPARVALDAELIVLALANLLSNAAKYSPHDAPVVLELSAEHMLHYRVIDQGTGISPEQRQRLFQVFQRASDAVKHEGFGIGLAIAWRIAHLHGGTLAYEEGRDGGAVFVLSLPLRPPISPISPIPPIT